MHQLTGRKSLSKDFYLHGRILRNYNIKVSRKKVLLYRCTVYCSKVHPMLRFQAKILRLIMHRRANSCLIVGSNFTKLRKKNWLNKNECETYKFSYIQSPNSLHCMKKKWGRYRKSNFQGHKNSQGWTKQRRNSIDSKIIVIAIKMYCYFPYSTFILIHECIRWLLS